MSAACARRSIAATAPIRSALSVAPAIRSTIVSASRRRKPTTRRLSHRPFVAAAVGRRLIGDARVIGAVGQSGDRIAAAEKEMAAAGVADRPAAGLLVQFQDSAALTDRNDVADQFRLGLQLVIVGV